MAKKKEAEAIFRSMLYMYVHARNDTVGAKIAMYLGGQKSSDVIAERTANVLTKWKLGR